MSDDEKVSVTAVVTPAPDVPGQWVVECQEIGLVTQGNSLSHALEMAREAVADVIADDMLHGFDPLGRWA